MSLLFINCSIHFLSGSDRTVKCCSLGAMNRSDVCREFIGEFRASFFATLLFQITVV
jgi:hypothetical protein